ncbi:hypothetical protein TorRG33x02_230120, partial [Trema orientale]
MKRKKVRVLGLAQQRIEHRVDGKNGGTTVRINRVASVESGLIEVILANERRREVARCGGGASGGGARQRLLQAWRRRGTEGRRMRAERGGGGGGGG